MNKLIFKLFYLRIFLGTYFVILIFLLSGCNLITGDAVEQIPKETNKNPEVYFCPKEDCGKIYETEIKSANSTVHCALYDINLKNVISSLAQKSKSADVKIVMDNSNYKEQIKGDGVRFDDDNQLMHNKFCVIDDSVVMTGSFNPTDNDNYHNNNNVVVVYSTVLANNYEDEFDELWNSKFGKGIKVKTPILFVNDIKLGNYFCPEDNCASHIIELIKDANNSIYFMAYSFTNEKIADALVKKGKLDVRGIFDTGQSSNEFSQFKRLQDFGIEVKKDKSKYKMHHKVFIIDNETVATGSFNPTLSADTKNDENLIIIHDKKIADEFLKEFDTLW